MNVSSVAAFCKVALCIVFAQAGLAGAADLKLLSATGMRSVLDELTPQFERDSGHKLAIQYDASSGLKRKIDAGESFDVVILTPPVMDELIRQARVQDSTRTAIGRSGMGLAARSGARMPAIDSSDDLKRALLGTKSLAYSPEGTTGVHLARIFERFGIAEEMKARLKPHSNVEHALQAVADGNAELAFVGLTTIRNGRGTDLVGALPPELQQYVVYQAAVASATKNTEAARALINSLTDERGASLLKAKGMEPAIAK
jgi:molybdate transport system substrate-binding protein